MMSTPLPEPNQMLTCPYNASHQIERYRMQYHLEKCRKQHPKANKVRCPFDATHIVNELELDYHVSTCSKRGMFDQVAYRVDDGAHFTPSVVNPVPEVSSSENWDDDNYNSYNPEEAKKDSKLIHKVKGVTPSERRKARMEGVKNYNNSS